VHNTAPPVQSNAIRQADPITGRNTGALGLPHAMNQLKAAKVDNAFNPLNKGGFKRSLAIAPVGNGVLGAGNSPRALASSDAFRVPGPDLMDAAKADSAAARTAAAQAKAQKSIADQDRGKVLLLQDQAAQERKLGKPGDPNDPHNKRAADLEAQAA